MSEWRDIASAPASVVPSEQATVYRGGRRRYFTKAAALKGYASTMYRAKHPCECEQPDYGSGYPGYNCGSCLARDTVMARYLRVLRRAERRKNLPAPPQEQP